MNVDDCEANREPYDYELGAGGVHAHPYKQPYGRI